MNVIKNPLTDTQDGYLEDVLNESVKYCSKPSQQSISTSEDNYVSADEVVNDTSVNDKISIKKIPRSSGTS